LRKPFNGNPTPTSGQCDACDNSQTRRRRELCALSLEQGTVEACLSHMANPLARKMAEEGKLPHQMIMILIYSIAVCALRKQNLQLP
jgi:hypothetical protein